MRWTTLSCGHVQRVLLGTRLGWEQKEGPKGSHADLKLAPDGDTLTVKPSKSSAEKSKPRLYHQHEISKGLWQKKNDPLGGK